ncbi:DNA replication/repair protein RecF [Pseudactinotalea sp. HY160]|uniref:DNA replication/repair protein RecF n=1 Tax=Pseudactinotalea sp. HY160 TaxID=2654490 RepID=UPI00128E7884|nr:DNA replication/repair protein RecF [Pseudactinotalea sp. HY160]MPV51427.1 DNA replication/repair protein RecF [Pseudactinotalea sp. HY160]
MYVSDLALTDFRSYPHVVLAFEPGVTALVGPNGQGKTNLVESLGYLATFSSHRVAGDAALVRAGTPRAIVQAKVVRAGRPTTLEVEIVAGRANRARLNRAPVTRTRELLGHLRTVLFAPEDLALVKGDPDGRRRFVDELLVLLSPRLASVRTDYERVIKQRNALLKSAGAARRGGRGADLSTLDIWDAKAAAAGAELLAARVRLLAELRPHVATAYEQVSGGQGSAELRYRTSLEADARRPVGGSVAGPVDGTAGSRDVLAATAEEAELADAALVEARLLESMARLRGKELDRGVSLVGPHRDDLDLVLGGLPAKGYASHGESWSFALALRLASYELLRHDDWTEDGEPVLILDDVFAELDARRRARLAELVASAQQVIITAAVATDVPVELSGGRIDVMESVATRVR